MNNKKDTAVDRAIKIINQYNGIIKTKGAINAGIHPRTIYTLREEG